ncbi:MAG: glucose-6-phosphate dehydrogenase, partial [Planctomycetales bacterium]
YQQGDVTDENSFPALAKRLSELESDPTADRLYYLSTAPRFYEPAVKGLGAAGLAEESQGRRRVVIEKPFGVDLESAQRLNDAVHQVFDERQIYRIDHYLGKETVQNILVLRFANSIFEPLWNRRYIDHVQITAAEEVAVGRRGEYYDQSGVMRDMFQNHLMQLLMITAMEPPAKFEADAVRNEKVKVLQAVRRLGSKEIESDTVRGQYLGYRNEPGVDPKSRTATFAAVRLWIDNWRWQGVPFYLRSGKSMACRSTQIVIQYHKPPHILFDERPHNVEANRLVIQVQPDEGIQLHFQTKIPDQGMRLRLTDLDFRFHEEFTAELPQAYERLLLDALQGDASLFARSDEVEESWTLIDSILKFWDQSDKPHLHFYEKDAWGPPACSEWMFAEDRAWFDSCPLLGH